MAQTPSTVGLFTTVRNLSGKTRTFGFLGAHGKRLAANESFTQPGDLVSKLGNKLSQRQFKSLEGALGVRSSLEIVSSPAVYLYDEEDDVTKELALQGGLLGTVDPQWSAAGSSNFVDG